MNVGKPDILLDVIDVRRRRRVDYMNGFRPAHLKAISHIRCHQRVGDNPSAVANT